VRELTEIDDDLLTAEAAASGYYRDPRGASTNEAGELVVSWVGPSPNGVVLLDKLEPSALAWPYSHAYRASLIAVMTAQCPKCDAAARDFKDGDDLGLAQPIRFARITKPLMEAQHGDFEETEAHWVVHAHDCPAAPRILALLAEEAE
jgi:hypothetical protein